MPIEALGVVTASDHMEMYDDVGNLFREHGMADDTCILVLDQQITSDLLWDINCFDKQVCVSAV